MVPRMGVNTNVKMQDAVLPSADYDQGCGDFHPAESAQMKTEPADDIEEGAVGCSQAVDAEARAPR